MIFVANAVNLKILATKFTDYKNEFERLNSTKQNYYVENNKNI